MGALHKVAGGRNGARTVLLRRCLLPGYWPAAKARCCGAWVRQDLVAPALEQAGMTADRVIYVKAGDEKAVF